MAETPSALSGIRVLDLTQHIAGPFCTKLLADYGADVIKLERPPMGDLSRRIGPFPNDQPHPEKSGLSMYLNTNKRGISVDLTRPEGKQIFLELITRVDVLVENFRPGVMAKLGLSYESLSEVKPDLVMVAISNFGQTGPCRDYKANELIEYAMGGQMQSTGLPDRPPVKLGGNIGMYQTGEAAALACCLAIFQKEMGGGGDYVDISIYETQANNQDRRSIYMLNYQYTGQVTQRHGDTPGLAFGIFPCKDGYMCFWSGITRFPRAAELVGMPELANDPRFADYQSGLTQEAIDEFNCTILLPWLMERDMHQAWKESQALGLATSPIMSPGQYFDDPYFRERGFWTEVDQPSVGKLDVPGRPFIMQACPWSMRRPAPALGQHNEEVLQTELGYTKGEVAKLTADGVLHSRTVVS